VEDQEAKRYFVLEEIYLHPPRPPPPTNTTSKTNK